MSENYLNAETFRVGQNNRALDIARGLAVVQADLEDEDDGIVRRVYIDPQQDPGTNYHYSPADYRDLKIALDPASPPFMRARMVREMSIDAFYRHPGLIGSYNWNTPIWVNSLIDRPIGRVAIVSLIDRDQRSFIMGNANILDRDDGVLTIQEMQCGVNAENGAGVSLLMIPVGQSVKVERLNTERNEAMTYSLRYEPESRSGIIPSRVLPSVDSPPPSPPTEGAGDREPRHPIRPCDQGSIALDLPTS